MYCVTRYISHIAKYTLIDTKKTGVKCKLKGKQALGGRKDR
jgi:hypothetical protein